MPKTLNWRGGYYNLTGACMQSIWMSNANEENAKKKKCTSWAARVNHKVLPQQGPTQFRLSAHPVTRYTRKVSSSFPTHLRFGFFKVRLVHSATRASHFSGSRDILIECSKQFKWNLYFYVSGQSLEIVGEWVMMIPKNEFSLPNIPHRSWWYACT